MINIQCKRCEYFYNGRDYFSCKAYPKGIPPEIITGNHNHVNRYKGDNNITFKPNMLLSEKRQKEIMKEFQE